MLLGLQGEELLGREFSVYAVLQKGNFRDKDVGVEGENEENL